MKFLNVEIPVKNLPSLDQGFVPLGLFFSSYLDIVAAGEMGIGNTTPSSAIVAVLTGTPVETVTGRGSGVKGEV